MFRSVKIGPGQVGPNKLGLCIALTCTNFSTVLERLSKENRPTYLLGDYKIDLLKYNHHSESFLNQILCYGFFPKIDRSTRITNTSATLIDNILTNVHDKNLFSGIWTATVSDHLCLLHCLINSRCGVNVIVLKRNVFIQHKT